MEGEKEMGKNEALFFYLKKMKRRKVKQKERKKEREKERQGEKLSFRKA